MFACSISSSDFGFALDGDADRVVICDEKGQLWNGDQVLAAIVSGWQTTGRIQGKAVIGTIMSNLGLEFFIQSQGLKFYRTPVGDRYIVEAMQEMQCNVGGEQSGHIILSDFSTTGDGLIAALQVLTVLWQQNILASRLTGLYQVLPQKMVNIPYKNKQVLDHPEVQEIIHNGQKQLGKKGRLVIRKSGTEPVIRIMVEAEDGQVADKLLKNIQRTISRYANEIHIS